MNDLIKALSEAVIDANCRYVSNYPGFHSNELYLALGKNITSSDEKNAFAYAWGCSMAGERAMVCFKNVGLNDAADAFLGAHFVGCRAGLVLVLFDDCDIQHSQSRIDIRPYFDIYGGLWLEPKSISDVYHLTKIAFSYSEKFSITVVVRVTNILYDSSVSTTWCRKKDVPIYFDIADIRKRDSRYVVHPSEAVRMEDELSKKNKAIEDFVETLYEDPPHDVNSIIVGAKRNVIAKNSYRIFTLPIPVEKIKKINPTTGNIDVYEHGATAYMCNKINTALCNTNKTNSIIMRPPINLKPRYHNNSHMENLFKAIREVQGSIVCGDLGNYTMDPHRTLQLCLCYGVSVAVAMGVADVIGKNIFCVTGDAAYIHSGQQCLYEMVERNINVSIFVIENGGARGTGGQYIHSNLRSVPPEVNLFEIDYAKTSFCEIKNLLGSLPAHGVNLIIIHSLI